MFIKHALETVCCQCPNEYATAYAKVAYDMDVTSSEFRIQLLYVKSNIAHWRGPLAQEVKVAINEALK